MEIQLDSRCNYKRNKKLFITYKIDLEAESAQTTQKHKNRVCFSIERSKKVFTRAKKCVGNNGEKENQ